MKISFDGEFTDNDLNATLHGLGRDICFVQVGAMDGVRFDPIHSCVEQLNWRGLLIEPMPDIYQQLVQNYASCSGLQFANLAIADYEGEIEMSRIDPKSVDDGIFVDCMFGVSTLMPDRGIIGANGMEPKLKGLIRRYTQTLTVKCSRLPQVLKTHEIQKIDLFVVDTEGADWMVTRQLPLETYSPRVVFIEVAHLSSYERVACSNHFRNHGYRIYIEKEQAENFLAIRR